MNKLVLIIIVILVAIVGGYFLLKGGYQYPAPVPTIPKATAPEEETGAVSEVKEVTVIGTEFTFNPSAITVKAGQRVKITFQNNGGAPHNLTIERLGVSTRTISGGGTDTIEFVASASGTYTFFCSVSGHRAAGMIGNLKVE